MAESEAMKLLFCETFSHENAKDPNLDLIQFTWPVIVQEIRVIPWGARVHPDLHKVPTVGQTQPGGFALEFFANNLNNHGAAVFERIGSFHYQDSGEIQLVPKTKLPTDGLVVRGRYASVTLAVFGTMQNRRSESPPPPPPPPPKQQSHSKRADDKVRERREEKKITDEAIKLEEEIPRMTEEEQKIIAFGKDAKRGPKTPPHGQELVEEWRPKVTPPETSWEVEDSRQQWKEQEPIEEPPSGHWKATWNEEVEDWKSIDTWEPRESGDWGEDDRHAHHWEEHRKHRGPRTPPGEPSGPHTPPDIDAPDNYSMSHPSLDVEKTEVSTESSVDVQDLEGEDQGELFEPLTPEQSPINRKNLSTSDIPDVAQGFDEEEPPEVIEHAYEEIVSDEEVLDEQELDSLMEDDDFDPEQIADDEGWNTIGIYDPFEVLALIKPLENFAAPYNTPFQTLKAKLQTTPSDDTVPDEVTKLNDLIRGQSEDDYGSKWVSTLEELQPLVIPWLAYLDEQQVDIIMDWSIKALDLSVALSQTLAVNTRQLKVGMKIVAAVAVADIQLTEKFIGKNAVKCLLELLFADHMASSLKLMALKALDSLTNWQTGLEFLLTSSSTKDDGPPSPKRRRRDEPESSGYQMLLGLLLSKQAVRVMKATTALVQKVHAYEVLSRLRIVTQSIIDSSPPTDLETISEEKSTTKEDSSEARETPPPQRMETEGIAPAEPSFQPASSSLVEDIESAADCLQQIVETIRTASFKLVQPSIKSFPTTVKLTDDVSTADPEPMLFHLFQSCKLLESVQMLLVSPPTSTHDGIFDGIRDLIQSLMASHSGLQFFSLNCNSSKAIIQALTNTYDDDTQESNESCNLGLQLLQSLQVMQYVDKLKGLIDGCESVGENEREEAAEILGTAYTMMFSPTGKSYLASVFGLDKNLDYLLPFLEFPGDELEVNHKIQISVSYGYASHLLQCVLQYLDDVTILKNYSTRIINCSAEENGATKWLEPVKGISYDLNSIKTLVEYVQKNSASLSADLPGSGPGLVTSLRVLKYFACPPVDMKNGEQQKDLRYKLATIQLFSADAMNIFIDLLKVIGDLFLRPWQVSQGGNCLGAYILEAMVSPLLKLIHRMVTDLLSSSSIEFRNERLVTNLLTLSSALHCSTATSGVVSNDIQLMLSNIQDILLTFTSCVADQPIREEAMISSSWGLMLKELLNYIPLSPLSFIGGLTVFSEMLPLPLPIQTQENLTKDEANEALIQRKLWSCYLHCFSEDIQKIIKDVSNSSCLPLQQSLRRVCMQLGDLAAPTALLVVQAVLTALHDSVSDCDEDGKERPCGPNTVHILNLLSYLVAQPSIKVAFLHMLKTSSTSGSKSKEPYFAILPRMLTLLNVVHDSTSHLQAQECIMAIEQVLCGPEVALQLNDTIPLSDQLANNLPCKEHMEAMCTAILDHVSSPDQSYASILPALRHLSMLLDHDYGFYHVKSAIERNPTALHCLFMRIQSSFNRESSDCLSTLSTSVDFIQLLLTSDTPATDSEVKVEPGTYRTYTMSVEKIREWLRWDANDHPLLTLEKTLEDCCKEDLTLESLLETIATLSQTLTETEDLLKCNDLGEITLPPQMSLTEQMNLRIVYVVGDVDDDRWSPSYWIGVPGMDEGEIEPELVPCDLEELRAACIPTFDLKAELDRGSTDTIKLKKKSTRSRRRVPLVTGGMNKSGGAIKRSHGMTRGNSYGRRPYDTFRQRPQNTSRPPSMHVDDFVAMEQEPDHKRPNKGPPTGRNGRGFMGGSRGGFQGSRPWNGPSGSSYSGRREMGDRNSSQRPSSGRGQWERRGSSGPGRGFPHRRPDSRQDSRPLPRAGGRGRDNPYIRGGPRGSMRGLGPSRGGPSQRRPNTRGRGGFRPGHWSTQGSKADHGRFPPPRSRAGYNRQGGRDRHQRSFTR